MNFVPRKNTPLPTCNTERKECSNTHRYTYSHTNRMITITLCLYARVSDGTDSLCDSTVVDRTCEVGMVHLLKGRLVRSGDN